MFNLLSEKFSSVFSRLTGKAHLTDDNISESLEKVKDALLEADVPYDVVQKFVEEIKEESLGQKVLKSLKPADQFIKVVHGKLCEFLGGKKSIDFSFTIPSVVMMVGLQGSGKTTSVSKLAKYVLKQAEKRGKKRKILFASVDYQRPAALEQLKVLSEQIGVSYYQSENRNPVEAAEDIISYHRNNRFDILFLDTAGRLHIDEQLLKELAEIDKKIKPKYKFLVLDAMTGQESLQVAKAFENGVGFDNVMLSKMDSDTRGGAAFAFCYSLKKPITFIGVGEKPEDLELFHPERAANRILGMGDIVSLVEKAEEKINTEEQDKMAKAFIKGNFTLDDFAQQINMLGKMGSISKIAQYLPGAAAGKLSPEMVERGEVEMVKFKAVLSSMTPKERTFPKILNSSRKQRIAKGAGASVSDVNNLLQRFEQSKQFAKMFKKLGKFKNFFGK